MKGGRKGKGGKNSGRERVEGASGWVWSQRWRKNDRKEEELKECREE